MTTDADTPAMTPRTIVDEMLAEAERRASDMEHPEGWAHWAVVENVLRVVHDRIEREASAEPDALRAALLAEALSLVERMARGSAEWYATIAADIAREYAALFREEATSGAEGETNG